MKNLKSFGQGMVEGIMAGIMSYGIGQLSQGNFFNRGDDPWYVPPVVYLVSGLTVGALNLVRNQRELTDKLMK